MREGQYKKRFCYCFAAVVSMIVTTGFAQAENDWAHKIYAEGIAPINSGDRSMVRQKALSDALNQASMSMGMQVKSSSFLGSAGTPIESQQLRSYRHVNSYSIIREWEDSSFYHVALQADNPPNHLAEEAGNTYAAKKKVAFTQFDASNIIQLDDISNPYDDLPKFIAKQLEASGGFLATYVNGYLPRVNDASKQELIARVAREAGVQFLVSGTVLDAGIEVHSGYFGTSIGKNASRYFVIELSVYDGLTGVQIQSLRLEKKAQGNVEIGRDKPIGSNRFGMTESGRVLNELIQQAATNIASSLACLPFSAHVVRVDGKNVYLDAGASSMLKIGDKLVLYNKNSQLPITNGAGRLLGMQESPIASIELIKIQPLFSIGELPEDAIKLGIKTGSLARFEFADKGEGSQNCLH
jgi:hypothetical protein